MTDMLPVELLAAGSTTLGALYAAAVQLLEARRSRTHVQHLSQVIADGGEATEAPALGTDGKHGWLEAAARKRAELDLANHAGAQRQQRLTTIASLLCGAIAIGVIMYGLISGDPGDPRGLATVAAGLLPGAAGGLLFWQSREASARADKYAEKISTTAARAEALRMSAMILDQGARDRFATAVLISTAFPELTGQEIWRMAESIDSDEPVGDPE
ncbi:TRADD-N-associated membrane domain-containing protein [Nocardia sp. SSK8]|uniref:TRADD-N-associated membrane domain-containing protein n=1 Tax=Nocardia sp. SSK8 TaxID=3120154 RepID=UPI00300BB6AC